MFVRFRKRKKEPGSYWQFLHGLPEYRLNISLVENRRIAGSVRQQHICELAHIDGSHVPSYFDGLDPTVIADRDKHREYDLSWQRSLTIIHNRFWQKVNERL